MDGNKEDESVSLHVKSQEGPSYEATEQQGDPESAAKASEEPPPSYSSVFGKVKAAKQGATGNVDYARRVIVMVFCGTLCCGLWIAFLFAIPLAALVLGAIYISQCPRERFIPIFLIVYGCVGILKGLINIAQMCFQKRKGIDPQDPDENSNKRPNPLDGILNCFMFGWFIAGCVWIYRVHGDYQSSFPDDHATYCHQTVYLFAFWLQTVQFIILGLCLLVGVVMCCVMCCVAAKS